MIPFNSALFISYLPYRKKIYSAGGWPDLKDEDGIPDIRKKLLGFFSTEIFDLCEHKTELFVKRYENPVGYSWMYLHDPEYPENLAAIYDPPPVIFFTGNNLFMHSGIAVVGTRNAAPIVRHAVFELIQLLKKKNPHTVIVSGFARGVDGMAHIASLKNKLHTVCVLGSGIFHPSPRSNLDILKIAENAGLPITLLSEFPPDTEPVAYNFPRRNRIIAGLSESLIVMQAPAKSGALISARYALDEGRDVYVFDHELLEKPGFNEGGRKLLEEGAGMLELDLNGKIIVRSVQEAAGNQLEFFEKKFAGDLSWLGEDYYILNDGNS